MPPAKIPVSGFLIPIASTAMGGNTVGKSRVLLEIRFIGCKGSKAVKVRAK